MDIEIYNQYSKYISILQAQEKMSDIDASAYPHLKDDARKKYHRALLNIADPQDLREGTETRMEDIIKKMELANGRR